MLSNNTAAILPSEGPNALFHIANAGVKECHPLELALGLDVSAGAIPGLFTGAITISQEFVEGLRAAAAGGPFRISVQDPDNATVPPQVVWEEPAPAPGAALLPTPLNYSDFFPPRDVIRGRVKRSCAVVGDSGVSLVLPAGHDIDGHEAVIRLGAAPTQGFEAEVGSRTTYRIVNSRSFFFRESRAEIAVAHPQQRGAVEHLLHIKRDRRYRSNKFHLLTVEFAKYLAGAARNASVSLAAEDDGQAEDAEESLPESVAWAGLLLALQICRRVTLFGFGVAEEHNIPFHYYDRCGRPGQKQRWVERGVIRSLGQAHLVSFGQLCLADCHEDDELCRACLEQNISLSQLAKGLKKWRSMRVMDNCPAVAKGGPTLHLPAWMDTGLPHDTTS
eukprot:SM000213S06828  [mRNA]  locus=s213:181494:185336:- [translate_table: standard]